MNSDLARDLQVRGVDVQPPWAKGGKVLASHVTADALDGFPHEIGLRTVIVHEGDEHVVWAALSGLDYDIRPRWRKWGSDKRHRRWAGENDGLHLTRCGKR